MKELLQLITELDDAATDTRQLVRIFVHRIRELYGPCGVALISNEHLSYPQCHVLLFDDENAAEIVANRENGYLLQDLPIYNNTVFGDLFHANEPVVLSNHDPKLAQLFGSLFVSFQDVITLPLIEPSSANKWMMLLFPGSMPFQSIDIERTLLFATLATNYAVSVRDRKKLKEANDWIEKELAAVARMQRLLLRQDFSEMPELNIALRFVPFSKVGGDYYDVARLTNAFDNQQTQNNSEIFGMMVADASGHGSAAAVEIAMFDAILRTYAPDVDEGPAGVFHYANRHLFTRTVRGSFITAFVSAYFPEQGILSYCNAGHPPPIVKPKNNNRSLQKLEDSTGIPLGITPDGQWHSSSVEISSGDIVVLYTDGVIEANSESGLEFGYERLEKIVEQSENVPQVILENIENELQRHQGRVKQADDQTVLIVQV